MALKWDCLEAVAGVGLGAAACFAASNPMAAAAVVPAVAGAKLFGLFGAARERHGLESAKELDRIRTAVLAAWDADVPHQQFDVDSADAALARLLAGAMPDAMTLGRLVATPDYPGGVVALVLEQLARRDEHFGEEGTERRFATVVIRAALDAALANPDYTKALTVPMLIGLGEGVAQANAKLDQLIALVEAGFDPAEVRELHNFRAAVLQLAQLANERANTPETALAELRAMLRTVLDQRAAARQPGNLGQWLDEMIGRVVAENNAGRFAAGADIITSAWDARQRERAERAEAERAADLSLCDFAISQQRLVAGGADVAAEWVIRKAEIETGISPAPLETLDAAYTEFLARGRDFGVAFDLNVAIELCRAVLQCAVKNSADQLVAEWQLKLGIAFVTLGQRRDDPVLLHDAVAAFRAALEVYTRKALPFKWTRTQNNLGNALQILGERQGDPAALTDAIAAYRAALAVYKSDAQPFQWAMTQNNLGNALQTLGGRQDDPAALTDAIAAYRAALTVYTNDALPLQWAMTQNNLGNALGALGERQDNRAALNDAIAAYRAALTVYTSDALPLDWAMTQNNLGAVLRSLGERQDDPAALTDAIIAYRAALTVYTSDALPLQWATTQNNLGIALSILGGWQHNPAALTDAIAAYRAALTVHTLDALPLSWAMTQSNLGIALCALGEWQANLTALADAIAAFDGALTVRTREELPIQWAMTRENRAYARLALARLTRDVAPARDAVADLEAALTIFAHPDLAYNRAKAERGLASASTLLAELGG